VGLGALVVVISGLVVASAWTGIPHSGGDNAGYIALAHGLLANGTYTDVFDPQGLPHTKYPPAFPLVLALLITLGARTWAVLKLAAAVPTVAAVGFSYLWAERDLGPPGGFALALILTLSAGVVYYSHWVLSDPLFLALTMGGLCALVRADVESPGPGATRWLVAGVVATGLAYFTRSAGLPLVVALFGWLAVRRRWRALAFSGLGLGLPMAAWWLRGRGEGVAQYGTEFWMVNPYEPGLGTVGLPGLLPRMGENLSAYALQHIPAGIVGGDAPGLHLVGVLLLGAAVAGWAWSVRTRPGPTELFTPLYAGLILLWPVVWGGDRFALPLFPVVLFYGAVSLREAARRLPAAAGRAVAVAALLALALPASAHLLTSNRESAACERVAAVQGPWACYGPRVGSFVAAAEWTRRGLPENASVLSRKPRHFYLLSGHPSRAFPFIDDGGALLALADSIGTGYVLLDQWDGLAARYVGAAVRQRPDAFCYLMGFGRADEGGAQLFGILRPEERRPAAPQTGDADPAAGVSIGVCPPGYSSPDAPSADYSSSSSRIPLLESRDP
jgi:hypothetical protein